MMLCYTQTLDQKTPVSNMDMEDSNGKNVTST